MRAFSKALCPSLKIIFTREEILHWGGKSWLYFKTASLDMLINASLMNNTVRRLSYEKVNLFFYGLDPKLRILSYEKVLFVLDA